MKKQNTSQWRICPKLLIDRDLYKGRGRPCNRDYRVFPDYRDFQKPMMEIKKIQRKRNGNYKIRIMGKFPVEGLKGIIGSIGK